MRATCERVYSEPNAEETKTSSRMRSWSGATFSSASIEVRGRELQEESPMRAASRLRGASLGTVRPGGAGGGRRWRGAAGDVDTSAAQHQRRNNRHGLKGVGQVQGTHINTHCTNCRSAHAIAPIYCGGAGLPPPGAMSGVGGCAGCSQVTSGRLRNISPVVFALQLVPSGLSTGCEL